MRSWCPHCKHKTEAKFYAWCLTQPWIASVKRQAKYKWCKGNTYYMTSKRTGKICEHRRFLPFDFRITTSKDDTFIVEIDGPQHFQQVSNWKTPFENQLRDAYKTIKAKKNGLKILRLLQEDVLADRTPWREAVLNFR